MARRGLTFIEVVLSVALLAIVSGAVLSAVTFIEGSAVRDRQRLEAMEVAHRVVLQHLDNAESLKALHNRYPYANRTYLFEFRHVILEEGDAGSGSRVSRTQSTLGQTDVQDAIQAGLEQVTVNVYLEDPARPNQMIGPPLATLTRVYSPLFMFERDSARLIEWVTDIISGEGAQ